MACLIAFDNDHLEVSMTWNNSPQRYGTLSISLHWLMAALFHHYISKDNTLVRMLPRRGR